SRCQGLAVDFAPEEIKEGGAHDHVQFLAGHVSYSAVTLTRALNAGDFAKVQGWLASMVDDYSGGTATITLLDSHAGEVAKWSLRNVFPSRWKGPELNATGHDVATETLELVHEGFL
ncbi:MAG: phage tail protein, partial [Acidimicrobiia bacterium]